MDLDDRQRNLVEQLKKELALYGVDMISQYGAGVQAKIANISNQLLMFYKDESVVSIGKLLDELIQSINSIDIQKLKRGHSFFTKVWSSIATTESYQNPAIENLDKMAFKLSQSNQSLEEKLTILRNLYADIMSCKEEISLTVYAAKDCFEKYSSDQEKEALLNRIEELNVSLILATQSDVQCMMAQKNFNELGAKIQAAVSQVLPLWKSQLIAFGQQGSNTDLLQELESQSNKLIQSLNEIKDLAKPIQD